MALIVYAAFWLQVWGPIGLIMSAPIAVCLVVLGQYVPQLRVLTLILGNRPPLELELQLYQRLVQDNRPEALEVVNQHSNSTDPAATLDQLFLPTLIHARRDELRGLLRQNSFERIVEQVLELSWNLIQRQGVSEADLPAANGCPLTALGCSGASSADHFVLQMLSSLMAIGRWQFQIASSDSLIGELKDLVRVSPPDIIVIASLPPRGMSQAVYLCKRLREATPSIPIIVGRLGRRSVRDSDENQLIEAGATSIVSTLPEVIRKINSLRPVLQSKPESLTANKSQADSVSTVT